MIEVELNEMLLDAANARREADQLRAEGQGLVDQAFAAAVAKGYRPFPGESWLTCDGARPIFENAGDLQRRAERLEARVAGTRAAAQPIGVGSNLPGSTAPVLQEHPAKPKILEGTKSVGALTESADIDAIARRIAASDTAIAGPFFGSAPPRVAAPGTAAAREAEIDAVARRIAAS